MNREEFIQLAKKISDGTASDTEISRYNAWFQTYAQGDAWDNEELGGREAKEKKLLANIQARLDLRPRKVVPLIYKISVAASLLVFISVGVYFLKNKPVEPAAKNNIAQDVAPGHNQATLTLANGQKILLTKGLNGQIATQHNTSVNVSQNNITYQAANEDQISYNTLTTNRGEQSPYPLVLADGTKVWLNAESSITFPTAFNTKERVVRITGEAYFEVKHNAAQPFKVQTANQTVEDIGTSFNVNAYTDEAATRTTLIEGSVKINQLILKPGEQTDGSKVTTVNTDTYTAWKDGNFHFEGDDIKTIMRQLSRWYDIDVTYQGKVTNQGFYADISRHKNISAVLSIIEKTKALSFKVEGRRVTVIDQK
jgi:transmembrane sensor